MPCIINRTGMKLEKILMEFAKKKGGKRYNICQYEKEGFAENIKITLQLTS